MLLSGGGRRLPAPCRPPALLAGDLRPGAPRPGEPPPSVPPWWRCLENAARPRRGCRPPPRAGVLLRSLRRCPFPGEAGAGAWAWRVGSNPGLRRAGSSRGNACRPWGWQRRNAARLQRWRAASCGEALPPGTWGGTGEEGGALPPWVTAAGCELGSKIGQSRAPEGK